MRSKVEKLIAGRIQIYDLPFIINSFFTRTPAPFILAIQSLIIPIMMMVFSGSMISQMNMRKFLKIKVWKKHQVWLSIVLSGQPGSRLPNLNQRIIIPAWDWMSGPRQQLQQDRGALGFPSGCVHPTKLNLRVMEWSQKLRCLNGHCIEYLFLMHVLHKYKCLKLV